MAKATYIITDMQNITHCVGCIEQEYATEAKALKAAKEKLKSGSDDEVWVWRLSHVVSKPDVEPTIDKVPVK